MTEETMLVFGKPYSNIVGLKAWNSSGFIGKYGRCAAANQKYKAVNFLDYNGELLYSYSALEFSALDALPPNPYHKGLVSQGWNWTKAQIESQLIAYPNQPIYVGQMFITQSGDTEIDVTLDNSDFLSPYLAICVNGEVSINWGDGSSTDTMTGNSTGTLKYQQHTYLQIGNYTISIRVVSGVFAFCGNNYYASVLRCTSGSSNKCRNLTYSNSVSEIRMGGNANINNYAFYGCHFLTSITIPSSVISIGSYAFRGCHSLTSITIPSGVTSIGDSAFNNCYSLTSIIIPSGVTSIGSNAFQSCYSLTSITIPSGVTSIGNSAFDSCYSLVSIAIPSGVTSIGSSVFLSCYSLTSITIPSSVTSIGNSAFQSCYSLTSITIPSGVTSIGSNAFLSCYSLTSITIPSGVTSIGSGVFQTCFSLTSITIPSGVTSIGTATFGSCYSLVSITIPSGVTSIESSMFNYCSSLRSITIPSGITSIAGSAFNGCYSLTSITIPSSVTSIGNTAFNSCYSITEYHLLPTTPPTLASTNAFSSMASDCIIYVPVGTLSTYQSATNWSTYASYMREEGT